jgi:hypothetical protein
MSKAQTLEVTFENIFTASPEYKRPAALKGHRFHVKKGSLHKGHFDVVLDGKVIGTLRNRIVDPFKRRTKGDPWGWLCSDSHSGEIYEHMKDAAAAMAARAVTGNPPPGCGDVARFWRWSDRCGNRATATWSDWMAARGPYSAEHPWNEPVDGPEGWLPECPA